MSRRKKGGGGGESHKRFFESHTESTNWTAAKIVHPRAAGGNAYGSATAAASASFSPPPFQCVVTTVCGEVGSLRATTDCASRNARFKYISSLTIWQRPKLPLANDSYIRATSAAPPPRGSVLARPYRSLLLADGAKLRVLDMNLDYETHLRYEHLSKPESGGVSGPVSFGGALNWVTTDPTDPSTLYVATATCILQIKNGAIRTIVGGDVVPAVAGASTGSIGSTRAFLAATVFSDIREVLPSLDGTRLYVTVQFDRSLRIIDLTSGSGSAKIERHALVDHISTSPVGCMMFDHRTAPVGGGGGDGSVLLINGENLLARVRLPLAASGVMKQYLTPSGHAHALPPELWAIVASYARCDRLLSLTPVVLDDGEWPAIAATPSGVCVASRYLANAIVTIDWAPNANGTAMRGDVTALSMKLAPNDYAQKPSGWGEDEPVPLPGPLHVDTAEQAVYVSVNSDSVKRITLQPSLFVPPRADQLLSLPLP